MREKKISRSSQEIFSFFRYFCCLYHVTSPRMQKFFLLVVLMVGLACQALPQAAGDDTIVRPGPVKSWPAGPYSQVSTNYGLLTTSIPLFNLKGKGQTSLDLSLVHRSITFGNDLLIMNAGRGWSHTGVNYIYLGGDGPGRYVANRGTDGWKYNFGTSSFDRKPGTRDDLSQVTGGYKLIDYKTKNQYYFDRLVNYSYYYLTKMIDPWGNQVTYSYVGTTANLDRITDASGRYVQFTYNTAPGYTDLLSRIHLQCGAYFREWDLEYEDHDLGNGIVKHDYLGQVWFPSPDGLAPRPSLQFDSDDGGQITYLRTFSRGSALGKLWKFTYGATYGSSTTGVSRIYQPSKTDPTVIDSAHYTSFSYGMLSYENVPPFGGGANDEIYCQITDPMGFSYKHSYYNDFLSGPNAQSTNDFPLPIKRVNDPTVSRYLNPRSVQTPVSWNWWEIYQWNPSSATCKAFTNKEGIATTLNFDSGNRGLLMSSSIVNQGVTCMDSYSYTIDGKESQHTDAQGVVTTKTYDSVTRALIQTAVDPSGQNITTNYHYNSSGQLDEEWKANDPHTIYGAFDTYGNAQTISTPEASPTTNTYDDFGNKITITKPYPFGTTTCTFDIWNRLTKSVFPDGKYVETAYDLTGNIIDLHMENGSHRTTTYNFLGLPTSISVPVDGNPANNVVTSTDYDFNGRKVSVKAGDGLTSTFTYNARGDVIKTAFSDGTNRQWGYDGNGKVLWRQNGRGQITYYAYDNLGQMLTINYQTVGGNISFGYLKNGLRSSRTDSVGTTTWAYNNANQLTSMYDAATGKTLSFTYQAGSGRSVTMAVPGNTWTNYYDPATTRALYTTQSLTGEIERNAEFWDDGSIKKQVFPNNTKTNYSYDSRGRVLDIRHAATSSDAVQEQIDYVYTDGNVSQYSLAVGGGATYNTVYTHDLANRLTSEVRSDTTSASSFNKSYVYSKGNDRLSTKKNGIVSTYAYYPNSNRLKSGENYVINAYDYDGNPTSVTVPGSGTWVMFYDEENRLVQVSKPNSVTTYKYNGDGLRVERWTPSGRCRYLLHGKDVVLTSTTPGATGTPNIAFFTPGVGYYQNGQMYYYQSNALGSNIAVRDASGSRVSLTEYDAYGSEYAIQGTQKSDFRFVGNRGYVKDDETGMDLLGSRYYLPVLGRFLNQDPSGSNGGLNLYAYCNNGPLSGVDPSGLVKIEIISYRVFNGGWHRGIVVIDNMGHMGAYSFAGGPAVDGWPHITGNGNLISRSGPWQKGTQDWNKWHIQGDGPMPDDERRAITLVDDKSSYTDWVNKFMKIEAEIAKHPGQDYAPMPSEFHLTGGKTANSNTWCHYLLQKADLLDEYENAIAKLPGGDLPWAPGWFIKVPYNDAPGLKGNG